MKAEINIIGVSSDFNFKDNNGNVISGCNIFCTEPFFGATGTGMKSVKYFVPSNLGISASNFKLGKAFVEMSNGKIKGIY